jgi:hypothetical protein
MNNVQMVRHIHIHLVARERCATAEYRVVVAEAEVAVKVADADAVEAAVKVVVEVESGCWFVRMHPSIRAVDVFIRVAPAEKDNPAMHLYLSHL